MKILLVLHLLLFGSPAWYEMSASEFFNSSESQQLTAPNFDPELLEAAIFHASNEWRARQGLAPHNYRPSLHKAARQHAAFLAKNKSLSHFNRKERRLRTPMKRMLLQDPELTAFAENLASQSLLSLPADGRYFLDASGTAVNEAGEKLKTHTYSSLARSLVQGWAGSPGHRANLSGSYELLGIGVSFIDGPKELPQVFVVQNFANP